MDNKLCDGCNVREPHEHRCWGEGKCDCTNWTCMEKQRKITYEQLMEVVNRENEKGESDEL